MQAVEAASEWILDGESRRLSDGEAIRSPRQVWRYLFRSRTRALGKPSFTYR